jgi:hypothetical protein
MYVHPLAQKQVLELHQSIDAWILRAKIGEHALHDYVPVSGFASTAEKTFHSDAEDLRIKFQITSIPLRSLVEPKERLDTQFLIIAFADRRFGINLGDALLDSMQLVQIAQFDEQLPGALHIVPSIIKILLGDLFSMRWRYSFLCGGFAHPAERF